MTTDETRGSSRRHGVDELKDDLVRQLALLGDRNAVLKRALTHIRTIVEGGGGPSENVIVSLERVWRERLFTAFYERPLLLLAAIRLDVLGEGTKHPLWRAFGAARPEPETVTLEAMLAAMAPTRLSLWLALATRRVQTNDVSRAVAWRWPAFLAGCDGGKRPIALFDIGASAGLNLIGDLVGGNWADAASTPLPVASRIRCVRRLGFDPHPLDTSDPEDVLWLRACIWPGDTTRLDRFEAAVRAMIAAQSGEEPRPKVHAVQANFVPARLDSIAHTLSPDVVLFAYQTLTRGYIEVEKQESYASGMRTWLASLAPGRAAWIECEIAESGPEDPAHPAEIRAHVNSGQGGPGNTGQGSIRTFVLGRCGYHPIDVVVNTQGADAFAQVMSEALVPSSRLR